MGEHELRPVTAGHCLLFVYGQLQPSLRAPRSMIRHWPDQMRGRLYDLRKYPAAVEVGKADGWIQGYVIELAESELIDLDEFEAVGTGLYRRIRAVTRSGAEVWIYEFARPLPDDAIGPIDRWPL
jgi:gamma-glutamylcyclotransferase (GGCT)/AIG2-like uncharacterized protein YtfP